ncbi:MAG: cytochrome c family protein [Pseudomonadota bacterium]|nr:cytochrome c family protein [Pseudomonadota bacterium]
MDSFEWNKIAGWVLGAALSVLALVIVTGMIFKPVLPAKPGYVVEGVEEVASAGPAAVADKPVAFYLASADTAKGEVIFKKCQSCHNAVKGGPAGIGPNLWGVIGGPHAHMAGFAYSDAMSATKGKTWDFDGINAWLTNPKAYIAGNKMSFAGLGKPEERAEVIAYLNTQSDKPLPLPPVPAETAAAPAPEAVAGAVKGASPAEAPTNSKLAVDTKPGGGAATTDVKAAAGKAAIK